MIKHRSIEHGQALILVVFGMVGLVMATALAVDGGSVYSDRRHAQNAADTAALAAGLTKIRNYSACNDPTVDTLCTVADTAGLARAADNGYNSDGTSNVVTLYQCSDPLATCNLPSAEPYTDSNGNGSHDASEPYTDTNGNGQYDGTPDPHFYVQVLITSHVQTYFARVLGINQLTNSVQAVVQSVPPMPTPWYNGNALVATMPGCKTPGWPYDPFTLGGGSVSFITGLGGVFVNSTCDNAFTSSPGSSMDSIGGECIVGGAVNNGDVNPPPTTDCSEPINPDSYQLPAVNPSSCPSAGQAYNLGGGNYVLTPGKYDSTFPPVNGNVKLQSGIYCLNNGISINAGSVLTTDLDGNGTYDGSDGGDEGALLYVPTGSVTFNGGAFVTLGAINKPGTDLGIKGYLIYLPPTNNSPVKIAGSNGSGFVGTILAPASLVTLEGSSDSSSILNLEVQVIGYSIKITGAGKLNITYNQDKVGQTWNNPTLQLYR